MSYQLEQFGGGVNAANNSPAWSAMVKEIAAQGVSAEIQLNAGTYNFLWAPDPVILQGAQNISIKGVSRRTTILFFNQCSGLSFLYSANLWCAINLSDFGLSTNANAGTGLAIAFQSGMTPPNPNPATSDLTRLKFGYDTIPFDAKGSFATAISVVGVSSINYDALEIFGGGTGVALDGGETISVLHNFRNLNASYTNVGILYGRAVQGVTVTGGSNFTGNTTGIEISATAGGNDAQTQLSVSDSQFNTFGWGIKDEGGCNAMSIRGNTFFVQPNTTGIYTVAAAPNIIGNTFIGYPNTNGIVIGPTGTGAVVMANYCLGLSTGIWFSTGASGCKAIGNIGPILDSTGTSVLQFNSTTASATAVSG